jgi:hypothetical protein
MKQMSQGLRIFLCPSPFLIVAPHSPMIDGQFQNDVRTGVIAETLHRLLNCSVIINDRFFKPKGPVKKDAEQFFLDLFRVDHARKVPEYINAIQTAIGFSNQTIVLWVHGIFDHFAVDRAKEHQQIGLFNQPPDQLDALIAFGQGGDIKTGELNDRLTAKKQTIALFAEQLNKSGMTTIVTHSKCNNYRGRDSKRFNQYFLNQGYALNQVESIQLEIKETGFRNSREHAIKTAGIISRALKQLL